MEAFLPYLVGSSDFWFGSSGKCFGSFLARLANWFLPGRGVLSAWHTAAELVRKDLIKHFCSEKHQLIKIPTVCREELGLLRLLSGKNLWHVCTRTGECVCVCVWDPVLAWYKNMHLVGRDGFFSRGKAGLIWIWICRSIGFFFSSRKGFTAKGRSNKANGFQMLQFFPSSFAFLVKVAEDFLWL